jgi:hypothetical protein
MTASVGATLGSSACKREIAARPNGAALFLRQTDQLMAGAARIAFCHPGQAKRGPGS